jgi:glycosyltransferase involved in cell wall biosynthesis
VGRYNYSRRIWPWIQRNASKYDAILVNGVWRYLGQGIRKGLKSLNTPYFVIPHSMLNPWFQEKVSGASISKIAMWRLIEWRVLRDARAVLYTCEEERKLASRSYAPYVCNEDVLTVVGTSIPRVGEKSSAKAFLERYPELRAQRLILYLSRLHPMKGCDLLIRAFAKIRDPKRDLRFVIAGPSDGAYGDSLVALSRQCAIEDKITWTGPLYGDAKWAALRAASLFALPSHCEAFPVALLEALGCGLPALITDKVNIWHHVSEAQAGFIDTDTVEGTVRSLNQWLNTPETALCEMRANALKCFAEHFDAETNTARFLSGLERHGVRN